MKNKIKTLLLTGCVSLALGTSLSSCQDYLDKEPDSTVSADDAFANFRNFQGFVEEIYNCIPDKEKCNYCPSWNWGDDEIFNPEADNRMTHQVDLGNFRAWESTGNWLKRDGSSTSTNKFDHGIWNHAWYCIRKCNLGLQNIDKFVTGSAEEKKLIEGQLYFFRAWWHEEMMQYFGGMPYVDTFLGDNAEQRLPRLSYQECADKAAADFRKAADLLPINWDKTSAGLATQGKNDLRINKIMALGYLGKTYLWAASPLMKNGAQTGASKNGKTYDYDQEYAKKAAEAFGELLSLVEAGQTQYALAEFKYSDIYNHEKSADANSCFSDIFYTKKQNWKMPGTVEAIFRGPSPDFNGSNWNTSKVFGPKVQKVVAHDNVIHQPTANLVEAYGMANGEPIYLVENGKYVLNPKSGFDPEHPFKNRDPRFYHDIVFDGFKYLNGTPGQYADLQYCQLYTGGNMRPIANASRTGYFIQKLVPHTCNEVDKDYDWGSALHCYLPYMRLADIYLMYAEACAAFGGASGKSSNFGKTAEDAINTLRDRCGAGHVAPEFVADNHKFMDEVRREREVELSFEGFRFCDLQRWLLLTEAPYNQKFSQEFDRVESADFYTKHDPKDAQVANYRRKLILTRNFDAKHYWFPLPIKETQISSEFRQNPGW
ncbi:RagB/SusD family nutrient uptake outer membrane protein [Segatella copri]|uniref:RagB/SusD family nutrient uptake outer membrane protein n=1 Tax=Segatella copri TaxID=165179 RepID=A0AAW5UQ52_9BACT|nr:RagB/SusD family nutrient uptake outer membrane protein [Segatella copri]MCW4112779.1 RagB/SusD family nutrient uptake outer membrane protein [Segatella copri]MCW4123061.1 RagB/SusD family nutrient uptake outer membrane protein [Segatella copri]MCW4156831.1 RagB/SusD family nutrient uptake outer membrane protein [Segatella copri]